MHIESSSDAHLQDLFCQLARYFSANENKISAAEASKCFLRLSLLESVALIRLFFLLCPSFRSVLSRQGGVAAAFPSTTSKPSGENSTRGQPETLESPPELQYQESLHDDDNNNNNNNNNDNNSSGTLGLQSSQDLIPTNDNALPTAHLSPISESTVARVLEGLDNLEAPNLLNRDTFCQQQILTELRDPVIDTLALNPSDTTALPSSFDDDVLSKTRLATCNDIGFTPTLRWLLEACRTDRGVFLRRVEESKAALPNGQGWKAAIAIKQENADMRDLLSIYHRFECYNIYRHVVEAGFHTGEHWIRDKRRELAGKLCDDFPERFQDEKAANKCLNWVDQGCRYHEWTRMFSEASELGFLIALPSEIPRSAYTSRCTKEQMSAAAGRFMALGICDLVKELDLSELGNYIAQRLEEMTTGKRLRGDVPDLELDAQRSWTSPRLMSSSGTPTLLQSEQTATSPEAITVCGDTAMWDQVELFSFSMLPDDGFNNYPLSSSTCWDISMNNQASEFSFPVEELYQHLNGGDIQMDTCT